MAMPAGQRLANASGKVQSHLDPTWQQLYLMLRDVALVFSIHESTRSPRGVPSGLQSIRSILVRVPPFLVRTTNIAGFMVMEGFPAKV